MYKAQLSYKSIWGKQYPWVQCICIDPKDGMFRTTCIKRGNPPPSAKRGWTSRGIVNWNHATQLLKQHANSKWHKDAAVAGMMTQQAAASNVLELQCSSAAKELAEQK